MGTCRAADWKFKHCAHPTKRKEENKKNRMTLKPEEFFFHRGSFIKESRIMRLILRPPAGLLNQACEAAVTARGLPPVCFFLSLCYSFSWRNQRELAILLIHSAFFVLLLIECSFCASEHYRAPEWNKPETGKCI